MTERGSLCVAQLLVLSEGAAVALMTRIGHEPVHPVEATEWAFIL